MEVRYDSSKSFADYVNKGDCLVIGEPRDVADSLKEFIGFMGFALESGIDVLIEDESIDTRTSHGWMMMEILWGIDKFDDRCFGGR